MENNSVVHKMTTAANETPYFSIIFIPHNLEHESTAEARCRTTNCDTTNNIGQETTQSSTKWSWQLMKRYISDIIYAA